MKQNDGTIKQLMKQNDTMLRNNGNMFEQHENNVVHYMNNDNVDVGNNMETMATLTLETT